MIMVLPPAVAFRNFYAKFIAKKYNEAGIVRDINSQGKTSSAVSTSM